MKTPKQQFHSFKKAMNKPVLARSLITPQVASYIDNEFGYTPLILTCERKLPELALALIATGKSNPQHANINGDTALLLACQNNMPNVAMALIATGKSNPGQINKQGFTALIYAFRHKLSDVAVALLRTGESKPELVTNPEDKRFLQPFLNEYKMTGFISATIEANAELPAENIMEMYDYLTAETQNAGKGTTKGTTRKGTTNKGTTNKRLYKGYKKYKQHRKTKKQRQ